ENRADRTMKKKNQSESGSTKLLSMTGFARAQSSNESISVEMEIRAVNSRFLDLNFRLPREYQLFERDIRKIVSNELSRGRIEIFCVRSQTKSAQDAVRFRS